MFYLELFTLTLLIEDSLFMIYSKKHQFEL